MRITVDTQTLVNAIAKIGMIAVKESIITFVTMKKQQGDKISYAVTITAFDGKTQVASNLFAKSAEIDGDKVNFNLGCEIVGVVNAISREGNEMTVIEVNNSNVNISSGNSSVTLNRKSEGIEPIVFDLFNRECIEAFYEFNTAELSDAVDRILIGVDPSVNARCPGIYLAPLKDGRMVIRAMNGILLTEASCTILQKQLKTSAPMSTVARLVKNILSCTTCETVKVYKTTAHMVIQSKLQLWQLPLLDNVIPEKAFGEVIGMPRPVCFSCKKSLLLNAISVVLAAGDEANKRLGLTMDSGKIMISNSDKSAKTLITPDSMEGEFEEIWLNANIIKSAVGSIKGNELVFNLDSPKIPVAIREKGIDNAVIIVSPIAV